MLIVNLNKRNPNPASAIEPPLWASLIASYNNADILDAEALVLSPQETEKAIRASGHKDILLVVQGNTPSVSSTPKMPVAEALADRIKDLNVSMTGIHPIAVDYAKFPVVKHPFSGFPNLPFDRLPMGKYRAHNWHCLDGSPRSPYASIYTGLGCPFDCYYCNIHTLYGDRQVRFRPIDDILTEVETLVTRYHVRNIKIWDELFALKEDRVLSICGGLKGYDLNIWAYARLDTVSEKMLRAMRDAGIGWLSYGFESITDPKFIERTEDVVRMTRDAGINIIANLMFDLPGTTREDDLKTFGWTKSQLFEFVNIYTALPYPGSRWYNDTKASKNWGDYDQYGIKRNTLRDWAFNDYFTNPKYLDAIKRKFGEQALTQITNMLKWKVG